MTGGFEDIWYSESDVDALQHKLDAANVMADYFKEAYSDSARALLQSEDIGWNKLGVAPSDITQISLDDAKAVSKRLHGYAESNPILTRGREIRNSYFFSGQYKIGTLATNSKISPQKLNLINSQKNQDNVFGMAALERLEAERFAAGNVFVLFDRSTKEFQALSFQQIGDIIYNPNDATEIWYVRRDWSARIIDENGNVRQVDNKEYYPSSKFDRPQGGYATRIDDVYVNTGKRMIVDRVNMQPGGNLGIPDSFAAAPWALAYSAYLSDGTKVLAALAEWAWLVKPKKKNPAETAAANVRDGRGGAGGTLFTDMDVQALPTSNAVDLETGRPLAAQAASALGVSVVLILADPGQAGTNASAQTLSDPNRRTMESRRQKNTEFIMHCMELLGVEQPTVQWPKMSPGTDADETSIVMQLWGSGQFHVDEIRPRLAELGHITLLHDEAPEGVMIPNNVKTLEDSAEANASAQPDVKADGSTSMSNGQGRDSLGVGNISHAKKSNSQRGSASDRANT